MAMTFQKPGPSESRYISNFYNSKKLGDGRFLITTDHGSWAVLSRQEYDLLRLGKADQNPELFSLLKENGVLLTEGNVRNVSNQYAERFHFLFRPPTLHIVTPTMRCNASCIYCHSMVRGLEENGFDMDKETSEKIIDFILKTPTKSIVVEFQGGDCLLNYDKVEHMIDYGTEKAKSMGKRLFFRLVSNLTLMNDDILRSLAKRKIMGISTSLDGPKDLHDRNRKYLGGKGTYDDAVYWIKRIKGEFSKDVNLRALCTITRHSLGRGREIVDEYSKLGFDGVFLRPLNNIGFAKNTWDSIGYSAEEYISFWKETLDYIVKLNKTTPFFEQMSVIFLRKMLQSWDPMYVDTQTPCGAAIGQLLYSFNGDIYTCDEGKLFGELRLGNVRESTHSSIFGSKTVRKMIDISSRQGFLCDNCVWNPYCGLCPIYTHSSQGTVVSKLSMDDKCLINKSIMNYLMKKLLGSDEHREAFFEWTNNKDIMK